MKSGKAGRGGAHGPRDQRAYAMEATWAPSSSRPAASTHTSIAPCRALLQTSGRPLRRRPSSPQSARRPNSPSALRCCSPVCFQVKATRSRANTTPALLLTGFFGLSTSTPPPQRTAPRSCSCSHLPSRRPFASQRTPRRRPSFDSIWVRTSKTRRNGCANSSRFGAVYMICAVGVYV